MEECVDYEDIARLSTGQWTYHLTGFPISGQLWIEQKKKLNNIYHKLNIFYITKKND